MTREIELIQKFFVPLSKNQESLNLQNDAAFIKREKQSLVVSSDMMIEDTHFKKEECPRILAKKILRVNLSDIAAMGAKQYGYFLNLAIPKTNPKRWLKKFCDGLKEDQNYFKIKLFGGDLSISDKIFLSITILGKVYKKKIHSLDLASSSSDIYVSGKIGDAIMGYQIKNNPKFFFLRRKLNKKFIEYLYKTHNFPTPELKLGQNLLNFAETCTDISDGLLLELKKMSNLSGVKANIFLKKVPISKALDEVLKVSKLSKEIIWNEILAGGEDYKLLFSINETHKNSKSFLKLCKKFELTKIGFFSKGDGVDVFDHNDSYVKFKKIGHSHF